MKTKRQAYMRGYNKGKKAGLAQAHLPSKILSTAGESLAKAEKIMTDPNPISHRDRQAIKYEGVIQVLELLSQRRY